MSRISPHVACTWPGFMSILRNFDRFLMGLLVRYRHEYEVENAESHRPNSSGKGESK